MPRLSRKAGSRHWPDGTAVLLRSGGDIFRTGLDRDDDDLMQEAWAAHRDDVLADHATRHRTSWPSRPWAWWLFESGLDGRPWEHPWSEAAELLELGELTAAERRRLPRLIARELEVRRRRRDMDAPKMLASLESLAYTLSAGADGDG